MANALLRIQHLVAASVLVQTLGANAVGQKPVVPAAMPVFGVVRDVAGDPVAGVDVRAMAPEFPGLPVIAAEALGGGLTVVGSARTNERGRFVLRVPSKEVFGVVAVRGHTARSRIVVHVPRGSQLELRLRPVRRVRGRVVDTRNGEERARAGQRVWSVGPRELTFPLRPARDRYWGMIDEAVTDAKGEFELTVFAGVDCTVRTRRGGIVYVVKRLVESTTEEPAPIILRRMTRRIVCTIVDRDTKAPAKAARVHVGGDSFSADAKGRCIAEVPISFPIDVEADGHELTRLAMTLVDEFEVALARTGRAHLRFVGGAAEAGRPRAGIEVCVMQISWSRNRLSPLVTRVRADADGRLVINRPTDHAVLWARVGSRFVRVCDVTGGAGDVNLGDISTATFDLHGTVLDIDGVPAAHIPVFAEPTDSGFGERLPLARDAVAFTDHAGRFAIRGMAWRQHDVAVRSPRSLTAFAERIGPGRRGPLRIRLRPAPIIQGRVVDGTGQPLASVLVSTYPWEMYDARLFQFGLSSVYARTNAKGEFSLPAVASDVLHRVHARGPKGYSLAAEHEVGTPAKDIVITMRRR